MKAGDMVRVRIGTNSRMPSTLTHRYLRNQLQARFSAEFCMAILFLASRVGLAEFTEKPMLRDGVCALTDKLDVSMRPDAHSAGYHKTNTIVDVDTAD